jgi:hypothetical protein
LKDDGKLFDEGGQQDPSRFREQNRGLLFYLKASTVFFLVLSFAFFLKGALFWGILRSSHRAMRRSPIEPRGGSESPALGMSSA